MEKYKLFFLSLISLFIASCSNSVDKVDYYLPSEFSGNVVVLFNCKDGIKPTIIDGRSQIDIPANGVVRIKKKITFGEVDYKFYLKTEDSLELKIHQSFEKNILEKKYVGPGSVVTVYENFQKQNLENEQSAYIFYVHNKNDTVPLNYNDRWIEDTLRHQLKKQ